VIENKKISMRRRTVGLIIIVSASMATYFVLSLHYFPLYYLGHTYLSHSKPFIKNVSISETEVSLGKPIQLSITGDNIGDQADIQIISVALPNLTTIKGNNIIRILNYNFTQKPLIVEKGDPIGSRYEGQSDTIAAQYPSIQFYSRPWKSGMVYGAQMEINPISKGKFTLLVKTVSLPNVDNTSHYPNTGIKDYQDEYVTAYRVNVN
jgi:hypothetical protein